MELLVSNLIEVAPQPIDWLWPGWLALGKLHLLAGQSGTGKSAMTLNLAATVSLGGTFPDKSQCESRGHVLIYSTEDGVENTIVPRLQAAGADMSMCHVIRGVTESGSVFRFDPRNHLNALRNALQDSGTKLLILDPIRVFAKSQGGQAVREALEELTNIAAEFNVAIIGITHFAKGTSRRPVLERILNSQEYVAVPRIVLVTGKQKRTGENVLVRALSNIGEKGGGVLYKTYAEDLQLATAKIETLVTAWGPYIEGNVSEILDDPFHEGEMTPIAVAKEFLLEVLQAGAQRMTYIHGLAQHRCLSEKTVKRAKAALDILSFRADGCWWWRLPSEQGQGGHIGD